jgi:hypothetical protein
MIVNFTDIQWQKKKQECQTDILQPTHLGTVKSYTIKKWLASHMIVNIHVSENIQPRTEPDFIWSEVYIKLADPL